MKKFNRRNFLRASGFAVATLALSSCSEFSQKSFTTNKKRPNFLFLFSDDQRFNAVGALNNPEVRTPNIDRLVDNGTSFSNCYIMGSCVAAVCMPSRAMLMTGRGFFHLPKSMVKGWAVPVEERGECSYITFPEFFRSCGYTTFGTGKQHNGRKLFAKGFTAGAKIFFGGMSDHLKVPVYDFDPTGEYQRNKMYKGEKFSSEMFSDAGVEFLKGYDFERPFMMYLSYTAPHDPRMAPKKYADMYSSEKIKLPPNFKPKHPFDNGELMIRDEKLAPFPRTPEIIREHIAAYYAMITHLDSQIGRVLKALEESGQADNTIIIFAGDNGLAVGQHGLLGKQNLYEHSVKVPLVISGGCIKKGQRCNSLCHLHDVFPTMCQLAGFEIPDSVESKSLAPLLKNPRAKVRDSVFFAYDAGVSKKSEGKACGFQRGVRKGDWKLIMYNVMGKETIQLFNVKEDPWEINNLADEPSQAKCLKGFRDILKRQMKKAGDKLDIDKPNWGQRSRGMI